MVSQQGIGKQVALNVTRTRVTVLAFNLTIISVMLSIKAGSGTITHHDVLPNLSSTVALFVGFCLTLVRLWWLLMSQNLDAAGLSRPWPFTLGAITTYLALSQTVTAFMHDYLVGVETGVEAALPNVAPGFQALARHEALGEAALLMLWVIGGATWVLMTYVAPLVTALRAPVPGARRWLFAAYYLAIQVPIYWVYAEASHLAYDAGTQQTGKLSLFALQFMQPLLWFR
jgi:hypothetical protein